MHILLIEPNTLLAKTYTQALQHAGYSVAHVTSAQAAIDAADERRPDLVVTELQLPLHNGIEFLHEFRSYPDWGNVPVIINSTLPPVRAAAVAGKLRDDLGGRTILYKPRVSLPQFLNAVREQLGAIPPAATA